MLAKNKGTNISQGESRQVPNRVLVPPDGHDKDLQEHGGRGRKREFYLPEK